MSVENEVGPHCPKWLVRVERSELDHRLVMGFKASGKSLPLTAIGLLGYLLLFWNDNSYNREGHKEEMVCYLQRLLANSGASHRW